ncbi:MAG: hypothetical protein U1F68_06635 [Gammaproteobacteria bacterium]
MITKLALTTIGLIAVALGLIVMLNQAKFEYAFSEQAESRFAFVVKELKSTIETGLNLGLSLTDARNIEDIIERELASDDHILAITLFDQHQILFHVEKNHGAANQPDVAALWRQASATADADDWRQKTPGKRLVGATLINNFGQKAGGIALEYDRAFYDRNVGQMLIELARTATILALGMAPLIFASLFLLFRRMRASLSRIRPAIAKLLGDAKTANFQPTADATLELHYAAAEHEIKQVLGVLEIERSRLANPTSGA